MQKLAVLLAPTVFLSLGSFIYHRYIGVNDKNSLIQASIPIMLNLPFLCILFGMNHNDLTIYYLFGTYTVQIVSVFLLTRRINRMLYSVKYYLNI